MYTSTVSPKGAVVIPAELRKKYRIEPGCKVQIVEVDGRLQLVVLPKDVIKHARGSLKRKKSALELLEEERARDRAHEEFLQKVVRAKNDK